jgi:hypothetical protein
MRLGKRKKEQHPSLPKCGCNGCKFVQLTGSSGNG